MARPESKLLKNIGSVFEIFKALINEVLDLGGNDEDVRRIITDKKLLREIAKMIVGTIGDVYHVVIDRSRSFLDRIKAGNYGWVNPDITADNFTIEILNERVEKDLVLFNPFVDGECSSISSEDAVKEMDKQGLRLATAEEIFAFGEKFPDKQRKYGIVALGSVWCGPDGYRRVLVLDRDGSNRELYLRDWGGDWSSGCRFLAVGK